MTSDETRQNIEQQHEEYQRRVASGELGNTIEDARGFADQYRELSKRLFVAIATRVVRDRIEAREMMK